MVQLYQCFTVEKGKRKQRWKVVDHPYFDAYALVRDYSGLFGRMKDGKCKEDYDHVVAGFKDIVDAYKIAYDHT